MDQQYNYGGLRPLEISKINAEFESHWLEWKTAFEIFLQVNGITDPIKKKLHLLHQGGIDIQKIYNSLPNTNEIISATNDVYKIALKQLDNYFVSKKVLVVERLKFRALVQGNDTIDEFVFKLKQQAAKCQLEENVLEFYMIDQIVDKCASNDLQKRFLEKNMTLDEIINLAKAFEMAQISSKSLNSDKSAAYVNKIETAVKRQCYRCGNENHLSTFEKCPGRKQKCATCGKYGHFTKHCRSRSVKKKNENMNKENDSSNKKPKMESVNKIDLDNNEPGDYVFALQDGSDTDDDDEIINVRIGGVETKITIDSGSSCNIIPSIIWEKLKSNKIEVANMKKGCSKPISAFATTKPLEIIGSFEARIEVQNKELNTLFYVSKYGNKCLLSKNTSKKLGVLKLGLSVNAVGEMRAFPKMKGIQVEIPVDPNVKPVCQPYRRIPIPMLEAIDKKLLEMEDQDIIEKVDEPSKWVSPMVIVMKANGKDLRICLDMRQVNKAVKRLNHPLPTIDELLPELNDAKVFARLDVKNAFHQLELHENSRHLTTFITHKGLYRYKRLMFGISAAPEIFQKKLEQILSDCSGTFNYIDDIILFAPTKDVLKTRLKAVLDKLNSYNIQLNEDKCIYVAEQLEFLGYVLSSNGIQPSPEKINAIKCFRPPNTAEELRSFLGLVNFNSKFIHDYATLTEPLREILREVTFEWNDKAMNAFEILKQKLSENSSIGFYNPKLKTRVIADASPVGLGAVLLQFHNNGEPRIVYYAAKILSNVERRYSQCEKEALALVWAVERFRMFLYGKKFELVTDHRALETIFKPDSKPCARIERWVLRLQAFSFDIIYCESRNNIADPLSRLYSDPNMEAKQFDLDVEEHVCALTKIAKPTAVSMKQIEEHSVKDAEIQAIKDGMERGSWSEIGKKYRVFEHEFMFYGDILLRGDKIVIPQSLQETILSLAHEGHPGITVMKRRLRTKVWFYKMDSLTEDFVKSCHGCLIVSAPEKPMPMKRRELPTSAWTDLAMDFVGPLPNGQQVLIVIDYYSRFQVINFMTKITSEQTIKVLESMFAYYGNPKSITSDNATTFRSEEFSNFCFQNNIKMHNSCPYWSQQNGEVERQNSSLLKRLRIAYSEDIDLKEEVNRYLQMYHNTPHSTTGKSPHELMFNRKGRDKLPMIEDVTLESEVNDEDAINKAKGKEYSDKRRHAKETDLVIGDKVYIKNLLPKHKLSPKFVPELYTIKEIRGGDILVIDENGIERRRNVAHVKKVTGDVTSADSAELDQQNNQIIPHKSDQNQLTASDDMEPSSKRQRKIPTRYKDFKLM